MSTNDNPKLNPETRLLINGQLVDAKSGKTYDNIDPATEEVIGVAADAGKEDMELAIASARKAFDETDWSTNKEFRIKCLKQLSAGFKEVQEELRQQIIAEVGATKFTSSGPQTDGPIDGIDWVIGLLESYEWERELPVVDTQAGPSKRLVWKEAAGVVAAITPWNFPLQINLAKVIPALAAGCTVILKAAPETPWTASMFGRVVAEYTDIPAGVFNVITSSDPAEVAEMLTTDPRIDLVSFTGSTGTGKRIMAAGSETIKKVFLELGGKSAHIVLDDADMGSALLIGFGVCFHAGQGCAIATRFLLPKSRYEEGVAILKSYLESVEYGDPQSDSQLMGPLINKRQHEKVLAYIEKGKAEGARLVCGGSAATGNSGKGYYVQPTIFADVTNDMTIAQEEIFGPVVCVIPYDDDEDAIRIANDSIYGLSGSIFSDDIDRSIAMARRIRTGTLSLNSSNFFAPDAPFGGYKQSGVGREMGLEGFEEYLETKTVSVPA